MLFRSAVPSAPSPDATHGLFSPKPPEGACEQRAGRVPALPAAMGGPASLPVRVEPSAPQGPARPGPPRPLLPSPPPSPFAHSVPTATGLPAVPPTCRAQGCPTAAPTKPPQPPGQVRPRPGSPQGPHRRKAFPGHQSNRSLFSPHFFIFSLAPPEGQAAPLRFVPAWNSACPRPQGARPATGSWIKGLGDRKSTRLNSSH